MQMAPSSGAETVAKAPFIAPMGVRIPDTIIERSAIGVYLSPGM
jgi:hypothetical protein